MSSRDTVTAPTRRVRVPGDAITADRLVHPRDLGAWQAWQQQRRRFRGMLRRGATPEPPVLTTTSPEPRILIALDADTPSHRAALVAPEGFLDPDDVALLTPADSPFAGPHARPVASADDLARSVPTVRAVLSAGGFLAASALAHRFMDRVGGRTFVVQHGALTPFSPPLPATTLLAWSAADGDLWRSGRGDIGVEVTGSQLLWDAATPGHDPVDPAATPVFLGQLHGVELARGDVFGISRGFCRATGSAYRPHPSEHDKVSRIAHLVLRADGIRFAPSDGRLDTLARPVVAIFSSGILEAAAAGIPAWGYHPDPPAWIVGFWKRYGIAPWGSDPTPPPQRPPVEPAEQVARIVTAAIGSSS